MAYRNCHKCMPPLRWGRRTPSGISSSLELRRLSRLHVFLSTFSFTITTCCCCKCSSSIRGSGTAGSTTGLLSTSLEFGEDTGDSAAGWMTPGKLKLFELGGHSALLGTEAGDNDLISPASDDCSLRPRSSSSNACSWSEFSLRPLRITAAASALVFIVIGDNSCISLFT